MVSLEALAELIAKVRALERNWAAQKALPAFRTGATKLLRETRRFTIQLSYSSVVAEAAPSHIKSIATLCQSAETIDPTQDSYFEMIGRTFDHLNKMASKLHLAAPPALPDLSAKIPPETWEQVSADHAEIVKCYWAGAHRAAITFAARMLEGVLGVRYLKKTTKDPVALEWTFGKLVNESKNAKILDDVNTPGVELILKFLNESRVASVHVVTGSLYEVKAQRSRNLLEIACSVANELAS
jgi:hypothetical protein